MKTKQRPPSCCCFDNVRSGSIAAGIYTLIYAALSTAAQGYNVGVINARGFLFEAPHDLQTSYYTGMCIGLALWSLTFLSAVLLLLGVSKDQRYLLLPYMTVMPVIILVQLAACIMMTYAAIKLGTATGDYFSYMSGILYGIIAVLAVLSVLNVWCFLCVVAQYKELRDGRGRRRDVEAAWSGYAMLPLEETDAEVAPPLEMKPCGPPPSYSPNPPPEQYPDHDIQQSAPI